MLLADVLASAKAKGHHLDQYLSDMKSIIKKSEEAQASIKQALLSRYEEFSSVLHDTKTFQDKLNACIEEISDHESTTGKEIFSNKENTIGEVAHIATRWRELKIELDAVETLLQIHNAIEEAKIFHLNQNYKEAANKIVEAEHLLEKTANDKIISHLDVISCINDSLLLNKHKVYADLLEVWNTSVKWTDCDGYNATLIIQPLKDENYKDVSVSDLMFAFHAIGELRKQIRSFSKTLLNAILKPVISGKRVKLDSVSSGIISISVEDVIKDRSVALTLTSVLKVLELLCKYIFCKESKDGESMMSLLGEQLKTDLFELILKDCLIGMVPTNQAELATYEQTVSVELSIFHSSLVEIGFCEPADKSLLEYATNLDTIFSNKACAHLLARAKELIVEPLHETKMVEFDDRSILLDGKQIAHDSNLSRILPAKSLHFPKCQVSKSALDLVDLLYQSLEEACSSSAQYAGRLLTTARNILSLYLHIVPTAHQHTLYTIPQHAALAHNNGMMIAHHCLLFCHQYKSRLPAELSEQVTMTDLAYFIRTSCCEIFLKAMRCHRDSLMETLQEGLDNPSIGCDVMVASGGKKSVECCLSQLNRLNSVWQNTLPVSVYLKSMGTLVNTLVEEIISRIIRLQDISTDCATTFVNVISLISDRVPPLFKVDGLPESNEADIMKHVAQWQKLSELGLVLEASLIEIGDRWAAGKGPLALYFTAIEVRQLIRALFQNTDKRSKLLSLIK